MATGWRSPALALVLAAFFLGPGCADGPAERFERDALPVLEGRCLTPACHGVGPGDEWPSAPGLFVRMDERGRVVDAAAAREIVRSRISTRAPRASTLLRIPLPRWAGGGPHAGGVLFAGPNDDAVDDLLHWIAAEERGGEDLDLSELEEQFGDEVLPVLVERCARDGCHGASDIAFTAFPVHPVAPNGDISDLDVRASRRVARRHLDLWSADPRSSRLVRKAIGESERSGLVHRGGIASMFPEAPLDDPFDAPGIEAMLRWARAEREALGVTEGYQPTGVVYVAGPPAQRAPYRIATGSTGSDLFVVGWPAPGEPRNLTAPLHPEGPVEIRDTALSHDASEVTFAMRREAERDFALWTLDLASGDGRKVSPDGAGSFVQPAYSPEGRIIAVWDGHGELGADGGPGEPGIAPELVAIDGEGGLERLTYTPAPEMAPAMLSSGKTRGELVFGTRRVGSRGPEGVLFRFPLCHDPELHGEPEYHVQFGASMAPRAPLVARDLPDGRQLMIVLSGSEALDDRGALAVLDRSLGPDIGESTEGLSLGGYRAPISDLDPELRFRDPAPLPDGGFIVSADTSSAPGEDGLYVGRLRESADGASLDALEPWLAISGLSLRSALPIFARPVEDDGHEAVTDSTLDDGYLALRDVAVLETLFGRVEPRGERAPRPEIVGLRLVESARASALDVARYPDGGTTVGLSSRIPARVLAEVPLPADRSAWLRIPTRTPVLLQLVDALGMEVGRGLDRWYYANGGEVVPGGTNIATYDHSCSGCHGAASGHPSEAANPAPDILSSASVTLSTYEDRDRRRPLAPEAMPNVGETNDFRTTIEPLIRARCLDGCHTGSTPEAGLAFDDRTGVGRFPAAYESLASVVDLETLRARRSVVVERLTGRELEAPSPVSGVCPPDGPDDTLVREFVRWIEAGAFFDTSLRESP